MENKSINHSNQTRLQFLDGLRGISAVLVLLFHTYSWNEETLQFGDKISNIPLFKSGWLGAELFFIISGFVIFMTLEKSNNIKTFFKKRFIRIYPALFVSCMLLLLTYILLGHGRVGQYFPDYNLFDVLSSFTLTDTYFWNIAMKLTGTNIYVNGLNASFWTLFVEIKFYILFGIAYFLLGSKKSIYALFLWSILSLSIDIFWFPPGLIRVFWATISGVYFGWFSIGVAIYMYIKEKDRMMLYVAIGMSFLSIAYLGRIRGDIVIADYMMASTLCLFFILSATQPFIQKALSIKFLLFLGFISYPLYLLHEPFLVASIYLAKNYFNQISPMYLSWILIGFVIWISWIIAKYIEPPVIQVFKKYLISDNDKK